MAARMMPGAPVAEAVFADLAPRIDALVAALPPETVVHTGHGDSTTLGAEAPHRQEWLDRGH